MYTKQGVWVARSTIIRSFTYSHWSDPRRLQPLPKDNIMLAPPFYNALYGIINKLQVTEHYINCSSWYFFRSTQCYKQGTKSPVASSKMLHNWDNLPVFDISGIAERNAPQIGPICSTIWEMYIAVLCHRSIR